MQGAPEELEERLRGHDVVAVVGAPVFRYYPFVGGYFLPEATVQWHVTEDPSEAARAYVGNAVLADLGLVPEHARFTSLSISSVQARASWVTYRGQMKYFTPQAWLHSLTHPLCGGRL